MDNVFSDWNKVDLHIHTDWSKKTKNNDYCGSFSISKLHEKLIENDVGLFSLTDHNIFNLPAYKEYYTNYSNVKDPILLPGIELDIEGSSRVYHTLLVFNYKTYEDVEKISKRLEEKYTEKGLSLKDRKVTFDEVINIIPDDDFFFIPHAGNTASIVGGYKSNIEEAQKMLILLQSPMEKVPEKRRQIYNEGFDRILYEAFRNKDDYAYIEFSDNHNIENYPCTNKGGKGNHAFYYIKGSKNYETLRLAFIDPKSRIKSSIAYANINQPRNYIEALKIEENESLKKNVLYFSPHLNAIIGGRSSGKSLLLDLLSRCIDKIDSDDKYRQIETGLTIKIKSKHDGSFKDITSIDSSIIKIKQGDIVNYFENNKLEELAKKTGNINIYNEKKNQFALKKNKIEDSIEELIGKYKNLSDLNITRKYILHDRTIQKALSSEFLFKINFDNIGKECTSSKLIEDNQNIINNLYKNLEAFKESAYFELTEDELTILESFENLLNQKEGKIKNDRKKRELLDSFISKVRIKLTTANSTLNTEGQEKAQAQTEIINISKNAKAAFEALKELNMQIVCIEKLELSHKEEIKLDDECKLCLEVDIEDKITDLVIDGIKNPQSNCLYSCLLGLLLNTSFLKNYGNSSHENFKKKINSQLSNIYSQFNTPTDFLEYQDGTNSKNNSPGYNSEKYLQVVLKNPSTKLIIIDQPEDNLGNKFISDQLLNIIRDLKFNKQLFLVTHNPAIVVYGDAESIILAHNNGNKISYEQIKLEDESSQREICSVLDGGEYIFDNRAKKYNIQKLLRKGE
jgi:hypothetical protein